MISLLLLLLAGAFNAVMDTLKHHPGISIFKNFLPLSFFGRNSWRRKYKNNHPDNGPRFFLSKSVLVFLTDGWHLFQFLMIWAIVLAVMLFDLNYTSTEYFIGALIVYRSAWGIGFTPFYDYLLLYKTWHKK